MDQFLIYVMMIKAEIFLNRYILNRQPKIIFFQQHHCTCLEDVLQPVESAQYCSLVGYQHDVHHLHFQGSAAMTRNAVLTQTQKYTFYTLIQPRTKKVYFTLLNVVILLAAKHTLFVIHYGLILRKQKVRGNGTGALTVCSILHLGLPLHKQRLSEQNLHNNIL